MPEESSAGTGVPKMQARSWNGILLHQILQRHHTLTSTNHDHIGVKRHSPHTASGLERSTLWDGVFHAVRRRAVPAGLAILCSRVIHDRRAVCTSPKPGGWILVGQGPFNLVEGALDQQNLGIHHVRVGPDQAWWDAGFLIGGYLIQRDPQSFAPTTSYGTEPAQGRS
ncbi:MULTISPECIES: DUF2243 domain-containing protein [Actinomycetes]|uniref:Uncharacterized protein n=2 Tax=Actinomycetes TaxID=1760 RepID=A0ABN3N0U1_9ACTN